MRRERRRLRRPLLALALACCAAGGGCGGSAPGIGASASGPAAQPRLTRAELRQRADAVCAATDRELAGLASTGAEVVVLIPHLLRMERRAQRALAALRPPQRLAADYGRMLDALAQRLAAVEREGRAVRAGETVTSELIAERNRLAYRAGALATTLRLEACPYY